MDALKGWLPVTLDGQADELRVSWCWFGARPLTEPFFRDAVDDAMRLPFNQAFGRETPLAALAQWALPAVAPSLFIYHASRCGSTLLSRMLARLEENVVVSEPPPLDTLLRAELAEDERQAALRGLLAAYGQRRTGSERALVVKLDAGIIEQLPLLRACYPHTPWLFVYRNPIEIAVSHLRRPGMHMVPGLPGAHGLPAGLATEQAIALRLGQILQRGAEHCRASGGVPVNYCELPAAMSGPLGDLLGLEPAQRQAMLDVTGQHAKQPHQVFIPDGQSKQAEASEALRRQVGLRCGAAYGELEVLRGGYQAQSCEARVVRRLP